MSPALAEHPQASSLANAVGGSAARLAFNRKRQQSAGTLVLRAASPERSPRSTAAAVLARARAARGGSAPAEPARPASGGAMPATGQREHAAPVTRLLPRVSSMPTAPNAPSASASASAAVCALDGAGARDLLESTMGAADEASDGFDRQSAGYTRLAANSRTLHLRLDSAAARGNALAALLAEAEATVLTHLRADFYKLGGEGARGEDEAGATARPADDDGPRADALARRSEAVARGADELDERVARAAARSARLAAEVSALVGGAEAAAGGAEALDTVLDTATDADAAMARLRARLSEPSPFAPLRARPTPFARAAPRAQPPSTTGATHAPVARAGQAVPAGASAPRAAAPAARPGCVSAHAAPSAAGALSAAAPTARAAGAQPSAGQLPSGRSVAGAFSSSLSSARTAGAAAALRRPAP
jgi:hypothetical protein